MVNKWVPKVKIYTIKGLLLGAHVDVTSITSVLTNRLVAVDTAADDHYLYQSNG